jgi:hypothetical protein
MKSNRRKVGQRVNVANEATANDIRILGRAIVTTETITGRPSSAAYVRLYPFAHG